MNPEAKTYIEALNPTQREKLRKLIREHTSFTTEPIGWSETGTATMSVTVSFDAAAAKSAWQAFIRT